jgi:hypothetical protein
MIYFQDQMIKPILMKKFIQLICLLLVGITYAQTDGLSYQAVIIDPSVQELPGADISNNVLENAQVALRFTITDSGNGVEYQEVHTTTTDAFGMINLVIGQGNPSIGLFTEIQWDGNGKSLQVELNLDGDYSTLNNQDLFFVPFAFHRNIIATGDMIIDGQVQFNGNLEVDGQTTLEDALQVTNTSMSELTGTLEVDQETTFNSAVLVGNQSPTNMSGTLTVEGVTGLNNALNVAGETTINNTMTVTQQGATTLTGTLDVVGDTNLNQDVTMGELNASGTVDVAGMMNTNGDLTVNGITVLNNDFSVQNQGESLLTGTLTVSQEAVLRNKLRVLGVTEIYDPFNVYSNARLPDAYMSGSLTVDGETNLNSSLTVNNQSPTVFTGSLEVQGDTTFTGNLEVDGTTTLNDALTVTSGSPTLLTGTLDVDQATGFHDALTVDGATLLNSTLEVANASASNLTGTLNVDGVTTLNNTLDVTNGSTTNLTGALNVDLATDLNDTLNVDGVTTLNNTLDVTNGSATNLTGALNVDLATDLNNTLNVDSATTLNNTLDVTNGSATNLTGALNADLATDFNSTLTVDGATTINNDLTVTGTAALGTINTMELTVASDSGNFVSTLNNINAGNGDGLLIKLGKNHGAWNGGSYLNLPNPGAILLDGPVTTVQGWLNGGTFAPTDLLTLVPASALAGGIATISNEVIGAMNDALGVVQIPSISFDGIVFIDEYTVFSGGSWCLPQACTEVCDPTGILGCATVCVPPIAICTPDIPTITFPEIGFPATTLYNGSGRLIPEIPEIPISGLQMLEIPNFSFSVVSNSLSSENEYITFQDKDGRQTGSIRAQSTQDFRDNTILDNVYVINVASSFVGIDLLDGVTSGIVEITNLVDDFNKLGVEYSSGRGDYAEWLERVDVNEYLTAGDIVAVKGGKITKDLVGAEQMMVVSYKPIVLGNEPKDSENYIGNTVAFMGQVPVKVLGPVHTGDYIVAHPEAQGYGKAISPNDMKAQDFVLAVGRSWEEKLNAGLKMVNTVVGTQNGDWSLSVRTLQKKQEQLNDDLDTLEAKLKRLSQTRKAITINEMTYASKE